jgi:carbon monoxide dehydrogenase subunit G
MINFEISALIDRPVLDVFTFICNPLNLPKWQTMIAGIEQVTPGAVGVGSKYKVSAEMLGRKIDGVMEVVEYQPPTRFGFVNNAGPLQVTVMVTLKPVGTGAKVTLNAQGEPGGLFKLAEGALAGQVKSQMEANLTRLKAVLESGA